MPRLTLTKPRLTRSHVSWKPRGGLPTPATKENGNYEAFPLPDRISQFVPFQTSGDVPWADPTCSGAGRVLLFRA